MFQIRRSSSRRVIYTLSHDPHRIFGASSEDYPTAGSSQDWPSWKQVKAHRTEQKRKHLFLPLDGLEPELQTSGFYPAAKQVGYFRTSFKRKLQDNPLGYYAPTTTRLIGGESFPVDIDREIRSRRALRPPSVIVETVASYTAQGYPAWGVRQLNYLFKRKLLEPQVSPASFGFIPPVGEQPPSAYQTHFEKTRKTRRTLQQVVPIPFAQEKSYTAVYPSFVPRQAFRAKFDRKIQTVIDPLDRVIVVSTSKTGSPPQPFSIINLPSRRLQTVVPVIGAYTSGIPTAAEPATIELLKPFKIRFERKLRKLPQLDQYTPTPPIPAQPVAALFGVANARTRKTEHREVEFVGLILDELSPARYPGYLAKEVIRRHQKRYRRELPPLGYYLPKTPTPEQGLGAYLAKKEIRSRFERKIQSLPQLNTYPKTPDPITSWTPVLSIRRKETERRHLVSQPLDQWTETPPRPFTYAAIYRSTALTRRVTGYRSLTVFISKYREAPDVVAAFRSGFKPEIAYLRGTMTDIGYVEGDIYDGGYLLTWLGDYTAYGDGEMTDIGYFEGDIDGI